MKKIIFNVFILMILSFNISANDSYPKLKDLINTIGSKDEFTVIIPNDSDYGKKIYYIDDSYQYIKLLKSIVSEKDIPVKKLIFRNDDPSVLKHGINIINNNYNVTYYGYKEILGINVSFKSEINDLDKLSNILKEDLLKNGFVFYEESWYKGIIDLFKGDFLLNSPFKRGDIYSKDNVSVIIKKNNWGSDTFRFEIVQRDYIKKLNKMLDDLSNLENEKAEKDFKNML